MVDGWGVATWLSGHAVLRASRDGGSQAQEQKEQRPLSRIRQTYSESCSRISSKRCLRSSRAFNRSCSASTTSGLALVRKLGLDNKADTRSRLRKQSSRSARSLAGQTDVIKTITSPSYSKSSIYPVTVGDRLYAIRDWGSDWTVANKRFTVEELDPHTGASLTSLDISAEWFTFLNDRVFFKSKVTENYWNGSRSGGQLKVQAFGSSEVQDLAVEGVRLYAVADRLVSVNQQEIRWHDPDTAKIQSTNYVEALFDENLWPDASHIFYGDRSVLWAWSEPGSQQIHIIRVPFAGEPEILISFDLEGYETSLVIDEHDGRVLIGVASSAPPRGIGITQMFLMDTHTGNTIELTPQQHIASAQPDAGGGVQLLVMP